MTALELVTSLGEKGVVLWAEDGALRFRGPKSAITSEIREELVAAKPEIIDILDQREQGLPILHHNSEDAGKPFPLTDLQGAYFVGRSAVYDHGGTSCHGYFELELPRLDAQRLTTCWNKIIERHPMLRAVFLPDATQQILSKVPVYEILETDLFDEEERHNNKLDNIRNRMSHQHFDAAQWPLFDLHVSHKTDNSILHVSVDLLIADYLSISVIMEELGILYNDSQVDLPDLNITFRDVLIAERELAENAAWQQDKEYWKKRLASFPDAPALPVINRDVQRPHFVRRHMVLSAEQYESLSQKSSAKSMTLGGTLLAVFAEVVGRWSACNHFALNLTVLNRLPWHEDIMRLVGDFTSVNLLEVNRKGGEPFTSFARGLQARLWEDLDHRLFGGVSFLRELSRDRGATVLMPVVFTNTVGVGNEQDQRGFFKQGKMIKGISQTPQVWLDCQVMEAGGDLHIQWDCLEDIFPDGMLDDMFSAFCNQINTLVADAYAWDTPLDIPLPQEQTQIRGEVNNTAEDYQVENLYELFARQARLTPQSMAVLSSEKELTYSELELLSGGIAQHLIKQGISAGENVAILLEKSWLQPVAALGVLAAGGVYIPLDPTWPEKRLQYILEEANVCFALVAVDQIERFASLNDVAFIPVDKGDKASVPDKLMPAETPAYIIYTSGSTGEPKGVIISHGAVANTLLDINKRFSITEKDRILAVSKLSFDLSVYDIFGPLAIGGAVIIPKQHSVTDPAAWVDAARSFDATVWNSVPALYEMMLEYGENTGILPEHLRTVLLSGDKISLSLPERSWKILPQAELNSLGGATEASIWSIHFPITEVFTEWLSIPYGKPLANQTFYVLNDLMEPCPDFVPGELYIGGLGVADGYFNDAFRTNESFVTHPETGHRLYRTGDTGCMLPDGNIRFLGRIDSQIKIRGHRIELGEIESCISECPGVDEAVAVVHREESGNCKLMAFAVPERDETEADGKRWESVNNDASAVIEKWLNDTDVSRMHSFFDQMDKGALMAMREFLSRREAFPEGKWRSSDSLMLELGIPARHQQLFRRILDTLHMQGLLEQRGADYGKLAFADSEMLLGAWDDLAVIHKHFMYGQELMDLLRKGALHFEELLLGKADPLQLLYPEGRTDVAVAVQFNYTSNLMNNLIISAVQSVAKNYSSDTPMRVFEVGAGVGGTSNSLIPALHREKTHYIYSDLSIFFLNAARERYKAYPFMDYVAFDINDKLENQGIARGKANVVIASNVLHNAVVAGDVLRNLRGLLSPGGWLIFIESTRDNLSVMTSMEFLSDLYHFEDERKDRNSPFLPARRWAELLAEAGADRVSFFPEEDHPLSRVGQTVFVARFGGSEALPAEDHILQYVREHLPEYMIPSHLDMVSALPVTSNGKIDRKALTASVASTAVEVKSPTASQDPIELELIEMVKKILAVENVGIDEDFYAAGGDSLLLTQLVAKMRDTFGGELLGWDETLRYAVQNSKIKDLAVLVRQKQAEAESESCDNEATQMDGGVKDVVEIALQAGSVGCPQFFFIPDGTATIAGFSPLLNYLDSSFSISALTPASVDDYLAIQAEELIPLLAQRSVSLMESSGSLSPFVCGYCMGGLVALEIARIMEQRGQALGGVAVINTVKPPYTINDSLLTYLTFIQEIGINPAAMDIDVHAIGHAVEKITAKGTDIFEGSVLEHLQFDSATYAAGRSITAMSQEERLARAFELYNLSSRYAGNMPRIRLDGIYRIVAHSIQGVNAYSPQKINGKVTLFRRQKEDAFLIPLGRLMQEFWGLHALGGVEVVDLPGNHWTSLREPGAGIVAQGLIGLARKESL
ncbi:non-ribosomal peptide synthetase [Desulfovibrio sp. UCD-KL4C]|uniref:non-ribosomal peptide synthetase n=1 Tax=Desulfovibrio sp. UCD-KL4C TaxID=2578120 RepID=UPI0025BC960D|nr:non-ribosomal peptide synthetase [Desulfovibrio sp. UCD-KL4C]